LRLFLLVIFVRFYWISKKSSITTPIGVGCQKHIFFLERMGFWILLQIPLPRKVFEKKDRILFAERTKRSNAIF
tara:strand:+ start:1395 stop:1616 length:222 start_codon:yes stop_codon:yes gene_type:complete